MRFIFTYEPNTEANLYQAQFSTMRQCEIVDVDMNSAIRQFHRTFGQSRIVNSFVHPEYHLLK
jgi:hypothetical protein